MRIATLLIGLTLTIQPLLSNAQDEAFIYGKITTVDDKIYEGPIRWGKEEVYWNDIFNAGKERNKNLRYLSSRERDELDHRQSWGNWNGSSLVRWLGDWDMSYDNDYEHQFACQFGEIKTIVPDGRSHVEIEMQNGDRYNLKGEGYNDVGLDIRIQDPEMGEVDIDWGRITKVEFMKTPSTVVNKFGRPLFGTVEAFGEKFTGYIQWDHDERLSSDKLDGDSEDGDVSIEFAKIKSIERRGSRSLVVLKSGRELRMDGSNDVSHGHRGVIIMNQDLVEVDVPWNEFERVTFTDAPAAFVSYDQYQKQHTLTGTVVAQDGKTVSGKIVFDLDEEYDYELMQGKQGEFEFITPFRNVQKIEPLSEHRCRLELKSGQKLMLDDAQDVSERNQGVLVFATAKADPVYVRWDQVKSIEFK